MQYQTPAELDAELRHDVRRAVWKRRVKTWMRGLHWTAVIVGWAVLLAFAFRGVGVVARITRELFTR